MPLRLFKPLAALENENVAKEVNHATNDSAHGIDGSIFPRQHQEGRKEEPGIPPDGLSAAHRHGRVPVHGVCVKTLRR